MVVHFLGDIHADLPDKSATTCSGTYVPHACTCTYMIVILRILAAVGTVGKWGNDVSPRRHCP
jgi:hypothetical protein